MSDPIIADGRPPALLALDWGTSSLRAFLLDAAGNVLTQRSNPHGIQNLPQAGLAGFEQAFALVSDEWLKRWPGLPVVAGGMVGSAQGWKEAPYVACPADVKLLAERGAWVEAPGEVRVLIAPGVILDRRDTPPDVMRGEEIQIAGALAIHADWSGRACMAMPGTHSKWVEVEDGCITRFATYMTGELFAVLTRHSILGRLMPDGASPAAAEADRAFLQGVEAARKSLPGDLPHQLFTARSLGLAGRMRHDLLKDFLSGLLIGHELVSALARAKHPLAGGAPLLLIGEDALCRRYVLALDAFGVAPAAMLGNSAPQGLFRFAAAAGLVNLSKEK